MSYLKKERRVGLVGKARLFVEGNSPKAGRKEAAKRPFFSPFSKNPFPYYRTSDFIKISEFQLFYKSSWSCFTMEFTTPKISVRNSCSLKKKLPRDCFKKAMKNKSENSKMRICQNHHFWDRDHLPLSVKSRYNQDLDLTGESTHAKKIGGFRPRMQVFSSQITFCR